MGTRPILSLFTFSAMSLAMMDREWEFLSLIAQGVERRKIIWIITLENLIYGVIGFLAGDWYMAVIIPLEIWIVVGVLVLLGVAASSLIMARKVWRSSMPDFLRNRMIQ